QQIFAKMMRRLYDDQCAFCGLSIAPALEAAHIKPWPFCTPAERLLPSNGLLLCAAHHKLFDAGIMHLTQYHTIEVLDSLSLPAISIADDQFRRLSGEKAHLPKDKTHHPSAEFLNFRREWVARIYER
ncbi:MAG TPA: HNH endonuclease, partial [Oculatellaceae cyanobacterium]